MRTLLVPAAAVALALARPVGAPLQASPATVESVLAAAGRYLDQYERDVTAVIAHEEYQQQILSEKRVRVLKSDLLILADADWGWVEFRDVFEVDGLAVRDRDERIARLFMKPNPNALEQARRISAEGARFNLNPSSTRFNRTLNVPLTALRFLRRQNQARSTFHLDRLEPAKITLKFKEGRPRTILARPRCPSSQSAIRRRPNTAPPGATWSSPAAARSPEPSFPRTSFCWQAGGTAGSSSFQPRAATGTTTARCACTTNGRSWRRGSGWA